MANCPECDSSFISAEMVDYRFPYGAGTFPIFLLIRVLVHTCRDCRYKFLDHVAEEKIDEAIKKHLGSQNV